MEHKEHPILFSDAMVRAILNKKSPKMQTRRVILPQPPADWSPEPMLESDTGLQSDAEWRGAWSEGGDPATEVHRCPYGIPRDRLWVREAWVPNYFDDGKPGYRADWTASEYAKEPKWKPSIHMPRKYSRIMLEITGVRVQQVQYISDEEICHELGAPVEWPGTGPEPYKRNLVQAFINLWDSINEKRGFGWAANPWVWAITFKRIS